MSGLFSSNTSARFWRLEPDPGPELWERAEIAAAGVLPAAVRAGLEAGDELAELVLGEGQFGAEHWQLGRGGRLYYGVKGWLPASWRRRLRRLHARRVQYTGQLMWPVEDRYVRFQARAVRGVLELLATEQHPHIRLWPRGAQFALVLTHDIESAAGQRFAGAVADREEALGFRSSFNFVSDLYQLDHGLIKDLRHRGFEVGLHGLRHDGKLFSSRAEFSSRAGRINERMRALNARGFRAPFTHRNPEWMQEIEMAYDLSFFDTDPYEPMPGGTMSVWPFRIGAFLELPYTLVQDHTLWHVLGERSPRLWLDKIDFIAAAQGMALLNTHPDYLSDRALLATYTAFLAEMRTRRGYWHARPDEVARWWQARAEVAGAADLPGAVLGQLSRDDPFQARSPLPEWAAS